MDPTWSYIGNPYPKDSVQPIKGYMDPLAGNMCSSAIPYHNQYLFECDYNMGEIKEDKPPRKRKPRLVNASLEATFAQNSIQPKIETKNDIVFDLKNALFNTVNSLEETETPVQTLVADSQNPTEKVNELKEIKEIKEKLENSVKPWWKDPIELIDFRKIFHNSDDSYNATTNHWSRIILISILASLLLSAIFNLNILVWLLIIVLVAIIFIRGDQETNVNNKVGENNGQVGTNPPPKYVPLKEEFCETPALPPNVVDPLSPVALMTEHPKYFNSISQNYWDQVKNRRMIKKVCPTTSEHGDAIKYIIGDTIKRHIFY
jgi:hypothetical protein